MIPASRRLIGAAQLVFKPVRNGRLSSLTIKRPYSDNAGMSVEYSEYGEPSKVLQCKPHGLPSSSSWKLSGNEVVVKMLMAPINPSDINMIEGTYMLKPKLPAVAGNEGVGEILAVGPGVTTLKTGDWVIPAQAGAGTWRTHILARDCDLMKVRNDIPPLSAATLAVNPCTAYRMLKDFGDLEPGDTVIQNAANSGVGQSVIQIAKAWGIDTINVVRKRDNFFELKEQLQNLGANCVITEEFVRTPEMKELLGKLEKPPKLALNGVGGQSATELLRCLAQKGVMVTYGGMSRKPVVVPTGTFIFKEIKAVGYWNSQWNFENATNPERQEMIDDLCEMISLCKLIPPASEVFPLDKVNEAVKEALGEFQGKKKVLSMQTFD